MPPKKAEGNPPPKMKKKQFVDVNLFGGKGRVPGKPKKKKDIRQYLKMHGGLFTTIAAGGTTVAGLGSLPTRNAECFTEEVLTFIRSQMAQEDNLFTYMEPGDEVRDRKEEAKPDWDKLEYMDKKLGMMWYNAIPRYCKLDGNPLDTHGLPTNKSQPPPASEDTAYELQWW